MEQLDKSEWYDSLVEDCREIITEAVFTSRWSLVEGYHHLGERIVTDTNLQWNARGNGRTLQQVAKSIGVGDRTVYYAIQLYEKYPDIQTLPDGKNITWKKIITEYLTAPQEEPKQLGRPVSLEEQTIEMAVAMICNAIDEHDKQWLLDRETFEDYFEKYDLPYDPVRDWVCKGFLTIEELLKNILYERMKNSRVETMIDDLDVWASQ